MEGEPSRPASFVLSVWPKVPAVLVEAKRWLKPAGGGLMAVGALMAGALLSGCSDQSDSSSQTSLTQVPVVSRTVVVAATPFCAEAAAFNDFIDEQAPALLSPDEAEIYMAESQARLARLAELAPAEVRSEAEVVLWVYAELDRTLAESGYDIMNVDNEAFFSESGTDASIALDSYVLEECGFDPLADLAFEGDPPVVLAEDELQALVADASDEELVSLLAEMFVVDFGLSDTQARCLASEMDRDSVVAVASGAAVTAEVSAEFVATLTECKIDLDLLNG